MHAIIAVIAIALLSCVSPAQNLVRNGDFSAGLSAWTFAGYGLDPKVAAFDVTGVGSDMAFNCVPGQKKFATPITYDMTQRLLSVRTTMEFTVDLASTHNNTDPDGGRIDVFFAGQKVASHAFGAIQNTTKRERICVRFTPTAIGSQILKLSLYRNFIATIGLTPRVYVDNVSLRLVGPGPSVCSPTERKVLVPKTIVIDGPANCAYALLFAPKGLPAPVPIPGFGGALEIDLLTLQFLGSGVLDAKGLSSIPVTAPASIAGVPLYWQAISVCPTRKDFGAAARFGFYR